MKTSILHKKWEVSHWFLFKPIEKIAFDTETTSLNYSEMDIVGMSFCDGERACYIDLWENDEKESILKLIKFLFKEHFKKVIAHNIKFDLKVLYKLGITEITNDIFCTMTAAHLINENEGCGLKYLAESHLGVKDVKHWKDINDDYKSEEFYKYALNDAIWCWELHEKQHRELLWQCLDKLFFDIEMPFQFVLRDLEINGILVDKPKMLELKDDLEEAIWDLKLDLLKAADINYGFCAELDTVVTDVISVNLNSSDELVNIIKNKLGIEITEKTPGGKYSVGKKSLLKLKGKHEFIDLLSKYKKAIKMHGSFVSTFPDFIESDGRIRTSFNNCVTVTGRLSSSGPNLQQLPKKKSDSLVDFRQCFIAPQGKKLIVIDFSGQEVRITGDISQADTMINAINEGVDLHLLFANKIYDLGIPEECLKETHPDYAEYKSKYKEHRDIAKNGIVFPLIYGSTAYGVAMTLGIPEETAQKYIDEFFELHPDVKVCIDKCRRLVITQRYVRNGAGRKRRFTEITKKAFRQAFNFMVQGYCSDILRKVMIKVRDFIMVNNHFGLKMLLLVHDEMVFEVDEEHVEQAVGFLKELIEDTARVSVELPVEIGTGLNYSEAK